MPQSKLFFTNRTDKKALELSRQCNAIFVSYKDLAEAINDADIIIVSSTSDNYTVHPAFFINKKARLILDLSVPQNVDPAVKNLSEIELLNVDEISVILDKTISLRQAEIPKAVAIIESTMQDTMEWYRRHSNSPLLRKIKEQLYKLNESHLNDEYSEEKIHKTVSSLAVQLHNQNNKGCQYISALSSYLHMN